MLHMHCPLDYCKTEDTELNLEDPNEQCAFNRSGILCVTYQPELSLVEPHDASLAPTHVLLWSSHLL